MKLRLLVPETKKASMAETSIRRYLPRTSKYINVEAVYFKPEKNGDSSFKKNKDADKVLKLVPSQAHLIALDEKGDDVGTKTLLTKINNIYSSSPNVEIWILVGGPFGLDARVKKRANTLLRLSQLTFNSEVATAVLAEQVYRIFSLKHGHPYHNE